LRSQYDLCYTTAGYQLTVERQNAAVFKASKRSLVTTDSHRRNLVFGVACVAIGPIAFDRGVLSGISNSGYALVTPSLLLVFILASIVLSPVQGSLGVANSVLVLFSMIVTGATIDLMRMRDYSRHASRQLKLGRSVS
jgi:hypothetical protein